MGTIKRHSAPLLITLVLIAVAALLMLPGMRKRGRNGYTSYLPAPLAAQAAEVNPWTAAVARIKENRGEPGGKQAKVEIPQQLRHYSDTRRFLAVQVAEVREEGITTPQDLVELAGMISRGEMIAVQPVTENYILFGVGGSASKQAFTRFENGKSIPLFSKAGLQQEYARIAATRLTLTNEIAGLKKELAGLGKRERSKRNGLQKQINANEAEAKAALESKELLDRYYADTNRSTELVASYESLASIAKKFPGRDFNIEDGSERRDLKVRLLSSMRPEAFKVMEEIATAYKEKFDRPLPITSLVRPDEYQLQLSKTNPNATRIETPPHSTGLAFDIFYGYMSAAEQAHVMDHLARLKDAGRIEVLRENRDHYHVFAFVDGARPNETAISASLGTPTRAKASTASHHASPSKKPAKTMKTATKKKAAIKRRR
ncbi:MAG TPA: DUF5715 family protein [Pyrinomonadaceae bacterium]|nr:DUF5715 family protein [Pyrinomonadaceae bacterium]